MSPVHVKYSTIHDEVSVTLPSAASPRTPWVRRGVESGFPRRASRKSLAGRVRSPSTPEELASGVADVEPFLAELPQDGAEKA